jgi:hypothetical protein
MTATPDQDLVFEPDVLAVTRCSSRTLSRWIASRRFERPLENYPGRRRAWRRETLVAWAASLADTRTVTRPQHEGTTK